MIDANDLDIQELKHKLASERACVRRAKQNEYEANKRILKMAEQRDRLQAQISQYKQAVDALSAENSKHKRELKRLKNKATKQS